MDADVHDSIRMITKRRAVAASQWSLSSELGSVFRSDRELQLVLHAKVEHKHIAFAH